ncbi:flippase-like domain-containing protein [Roseivirga sp.]|nr:flippase-like domain-containing protein [Roseivirga sp.]
MKRSPKSIIKYSLILSITAILFWYLFKDIPFEKIEIALKEFNYSWILLSIGLSLISHFLRAWRWNLLLKSAGHKVGTLKSYFAVMIGYLVNSLVPRLGEVTRCGVINRTDKVPIAFSFGTVITERVIDLMMLLIITAATFLFQFDLLKGEFIWVKDSIISLIQSNWWVLALVLVLGITSIYILFFSKISKKINLVQKIKLFVNQLFEGVLSLRKLKNQKGFWSATIGIWILYFLMLYVITFGSEMTKDLGVLAGMSILVMGSFGMAAPLPNGVGSFHAFVAGILVLYGIESEDGKIFALILHTSQYITVLLFGSISLILVNTMYKPSKIEGNKDQNKVERAPK